jgi:hypothetical protein
MIMKRLALLTITACLAVVLSACGERAEKKVETGTADSVQQAQPSPDNTNTPSDATKTGQ